VPSDPFEAELVRWLAQARADEAVVSRSRERALRQLAAEEATFATLAVDLGEAEVPVVARTTAGRSHLGAIVAVGVDFVVVRPGPGRAVFLPLAAVTSLRVAPGIRAPAPAGHRPPPLDATLVDVLTGLAGDRPRVQVVMGGEPDAWVGELRQVGVDVVSVRLTGEPPVTAWGHLRAVTEVTLLDGG
jgi:hypothetical protein